MGDLPVGEAAPVTSPSPSPLDTNPFLIEPERWVKAEKAARKIIRKVRPTAFSEERRREVIDYVQRLIRNYLGAEVFPYGSVPLKTYLPDGDIDLTAFGGANVEDKLADEIKFVLEEEEKNKAAEFVVKDVQLIRAEVKLVKCIVQNIVVDVSLNQIGGLSTLCFLEKVDLLIGKDHLFKHSIILIKAWCYYESRILGAHHGLISTYALETLVLYIFHLFHPILDGPLAVLYKFLDYFSKFDWETYCISLKGPVRLSSLPAIMAEMPEENGGELLLSSDLLSSWVKLFAVPSRGIATNSRGFQQKHLNIIDPLKENNNLGRSVSKGNFYRIRSAFSYGARKLGRILLQPEDGISNELLKFFSNTMARHGCGQRPDIQDLGPLPTCKELISALPVSETKSCKSEQLSCKNCVNCIDSAGGDCWPSLDESSRDFIKGVDRKTYRTSGEQTGTLFLGSNHPPKLSNLLHGDANDLFTSGIEGLQISSDSFETPIPAMKESACATVRPFFAPHLYFSKSTIGNGSVRNGKPESDHRDEGERNDYSVLSSGFDEGRVAEGGILDRNQLVDKDEIVVSTKSKDVLLAPKSCISGDMKCDHGSTSRSGTPDSLNSLLDLTGDYESYFYGLEYGRRCYEHASVLPSIPIPPSPTPLLFQIKNPWDDVMPPSQFQSNGFSHQHSNNFHPSSSLYAMPHVLLPGVAFGWEEMPKPRGTGTYFPNTSQPPQGYRPSAMKGRSQAPSRTHHNNGRNTILSESTMLDRSRHEAAHPQVTVDQNVKVGSSNSYQLSSPNSRGLVIEPEPEGGVGFGVRHGFGTSMLEKGRQQNPVSSSPRSLPVMQRPQAAFSKEQDRIALRSSYRLKDEDDFPPLSV